MEYDPEDYTRYAIRYLDPADGQWKTWGNMMIRTEAEMIFAHTQWEVVPGSGLFMEPPKVWSRREG
jgi:hypothetical protein